MNRRYKYLALSEIYRVPPKGGHVVWLHNVCRRLGDTCLLTDRINGFGKALVVDGVDVHCIRLSRWPILRPESLPLYTNLFVQGLVHSVRHRPRAILSARILPEGLVANALARLLRVPSVVFAHGEEIQCWGQHGPLPQRRRTTSAWKRRCLWRAYRGADLIIANTRFTADLLRRGGVDPRRLAVVHPGTDPEKFRPLPKDPELAGRLGVVGRRVILTVGSLAKRKGQDMVIRALPAVLKQIPDALYLVGGTGPEASRLEELARSLGVAPQVRFLGAVADELLPSLYNLADVFVMPNRVLPDSGDVEGFGIVFLEAGACRVPAIGGRSGGVPDAVLDGQTGLLVDGDSPVAVADAINRILGDGAFARSLGQRGRERVCRELTWDHSANRIKALIDGLDSRPRRARGWAN